MNRYNHQMQPGNEQLWVIREFLPGDQATCQNLYRQGLIGGTLSDNDTAIDLDDIQKVYIESPGNRFWVAEFHDKRVIGMIGVQHYDEGSGEIRRLRVAEAFQRRGIGTGLLERALKFCQERHYLKITLDTFVEYGPAIALFKKFQFRHDRTRRVNNRDLLYFYLDFYAGPRAQDA